MKILHIYIKNVYSCSNTRHVFCLSFLKMYGFLVVCVVSSKMITISNHNQNLFSIFLYNKLQLFSTYHVHYISFICDKGFLNFLIFGSILKSYLNFKLLDFHILKKTNVFWMWLINFYHFFPIKRFYYMNPFDIPLQN
jgi:hypothetical protein